MDRILFIVAIALLYSSSSMAADEDQAANRFQNNLITYSEDGYDEKKPISWVGKYGQLTNLNLTLEEKSINVSLDHNRSDMETHIGPGVAPLFGTYGVLRTSGKQDGSSYAALGFNFDKLTRDEADTSYSWGDSDLSFGFGMNNSSFKIEYMMHVNEENYDISAISLGYISAF
jgi:hypothetical protein